MYKQTKQWFKSVVNDAREGARYRSQLTRDLRQARRLAFRDEALKQIQLKARHDAELRHGVPKPKIEEPIQREENLPLYYFGINIPEFLRKI